MFEISTIYRRYFGCRAIPARFLQMKVISWKNRKKSLSIDDISNTKMQACEKIKKKTNWTIYRHISANMLIDFFVFIYPTARNC